MGTGLTATRLAILDLTTAGHQPMASADGRYHIVFNGEIYNFMALREELERAGDTFTSRADTEVILKMYGRYGADCVRQFKGMFAFAIWDEREKACFLARDPFGVKPLYSRIGDLKTDNPHREFYLTDMAAVFGKPKSKVVALKTPNPAEILGSNTRAEMMDIDALVRMAQPFSLRHPLIDFHGNYGSPDFGPAAERYTECRLSPLAMQMLADIDEQTVDFVPNYTNDEPEPTVLPSRFPNLLVNGSQGIAVGMATNIPPHNLAEVVDAEGISIAVIARLGGVPRNTNRTASPGLTASTIFGEVTRNPIVMGGMTGVGYGELVAAVANAGALGFITAHMFKSGKELLDEIEKTQGLTDKPFGVDLLAALPERMVDDDRVCGRDPARDVALAQRLQLVRAVALPQGLVILRSGQNGSVRRRRASVAWPPCHRHRALRRHHQP